MKNLSLTQLQYVIALAETGNFGAAARKCHVSQPTLSMQLQKLEAELGVHLFDRTKQPVVPTDIGLRIIHQSRRVIAETDTIDEILNESNKEVSGDFRLGVIPSIAPYVLPRALKLFIKKYPKVNLEIEELITEKMVAAIHEDRLDAGLLVTPLENESVLETPLFYEPFWVYVSDSHPLYQKKRISPFELPVEDLWLLEEGHCFRGQVLQLCRRRNRTPVAPTHRSVQFSSGSLDTLREMVDLGMGLTLLPDLAARRLPKAHRARLRPFMNPIPTREVSAIRSRLHKRKRIFDAWVETIKSSVPSELLKQNGTVVPLKEF